MDRARLVLRCGGATLLLAGEADDELIASLLPDDFDHDPTFPRDPALALREHRQAWLRNRMRSFRTPKAAGDWYLPFVVVSAGAPVGFQVLEGEGYDARREVDSSSFLVPAARGKALGAHMRIAILALAFEVLGAERAVTAARPDNVASRRVSERVGYVSTGQREPVVAGSVRPLDTFELTRDRWESLAHPLVVIKGDLPGRVEGYAHPERRSR